MLKRMLFAAAVTGLVAGATIPVHTTSAEAAPSGCFKAAKAANLSTMKERRAFRKECRAHHKAAKKAA